MPAINVARTDTFETQRQKINQIGSQVFSITQGGSDLATGNLKLGDGTRTAPSLAFTSDASLGIYKPEEATIGYVASGKKLVDFSSISTLSYKDFILQKKELLNTGISILFDGENYDPGIYSDITIIGGTGDGGSANVTVTEYTGTINNYGANYNAGNYTNVNLVGGSGSGSVCGFDVDGIDGTISNAGTAYRPGTYSNVSLSGGSGTGAIANIEITGTTQLSGSITSPGSNYTTNNYFAIPLYNSPRQTFVLTSIANPGTPPPDNVYVIDGNTQQSLNLEKGNTYRFDISDSSVVGHPLSFKDSTGNPLSNENYYVRTSGSAGTAGSFVELIIFPNAPTETIEYYCTLHSGMGATISVSSGTIGYYGYGATADVEVDNSNQVSNVTIQTSGDRYKQNDILELSNIDVPGGNGFSYTLSSVTFTGTVTTVTIVNDGQNYVTGDLLSASDSDLGSGGGSLFEYEVTSNPGKIKDFTFSTKGNGYAVSDLLYLPTTVAGVTGDLKSEIIGLPSTTDVASTTLTLTSTAGIVSGMDVFNSGQSDTGLLAQGTTVVSVDSATEITISANPTISGTVTLTFRSQGSLFEVSVSSAVGIYQGYSVSKTSGSGSLSPDTSVVSVDYDTNIVTISAPPQQAGTSVLSFTPPFGDGTTNFEYEIQKLGVVENFSIASGGNGYSLLDQLTISPFDLTQAISYVVTNKNLQLLEFTPNTVSDTVFSVGDTVKAIDGNLLTFTTTSSPDVSPTQITGVTTTLSSASPQITVTSTTGIVAGMLVLVEAGSIGGLQPGVTVLSVDSSTTLTLDTNPFQDGAATLTFSTDESGIYNDVASTTSGSGSGVTFDVVRSSNGTISSVSINQIGKYYENSDTITISGSLVGGTSPTHDIVLEVSSVTTTPDLEIYQLNNSGGYTNSILVTEGNILDGDYIIFSSSNANEYLIQTAGSTEYRFFLNVGNGEELTPSFTIYSGSTYEFDLSDSSNSGHQFALSQFRDGIWGPSYIQGISTTLDTNSYNITIADSSGILPGMQVEVESGTGSLLANTKVESVNSSTSVTLTEYPLSAGDATLSFRGVEYTDGVERTTSSLKIRITDSTPDLYYYCSVSDSSHANEGGTDNNESVITTDNNNPKTFGSGFLASVASLSSENVISASIEDGVFNAKNIISPIGSIDSLTVSGLLTAPDISGSNIALSTISSTGLTINSSSTNHSGNLNIGSFINIVSSSGNITTSGVLKSTNSLNINDQITITNNVISSASGLNISLLPATGRVAKVDTTTALIIPAGTSAERPTSGVVENGAIRFNTDSGQYEGYNASTTSWSSLGGVRDLDGNTYIAAEASVGANDNTLYFFNDGNNTVSVTPNYLQFVNVKKVRSVNTTAPTYTDYTTNTQVTLGQYLKYRNNIYEVTTAGQTGTSGNEPTHTTGAVTNGTAELTWYASAVAPLTFEEIEEVRIDPLGSTDLVVNNELRFSNNVISTDLQDLIIRPNAGKKITLDATSSLVVPVGDINQRGVAAQGSIRYNTTISQYEGYDGSNWTSLGGVKDVDGNTYIIPELSPGSNENVLFFYNDGVNTMRLSTNSLEFTNIDAITSQNSNLDIEAQTVTFNNLAATIDTSGTSTFISTTKDNLDLGLAVGLNVDPLLRLDINGDIYLNKAFGTGSFDGLKLFNSDLSSFELSDFAFTSDDIALIKGGTNSGASVLYDPSTQSGAKVTVSVVNQTTGDKEMIEYQVIDKGSDIFHTDIGNLKTGNNLVTSVFDFDANNNVRVTFTLDTNMTVGDVVNITVVKHVFKK